MPSPRPPSVPATPAGEPLRPRFPGATEDYQIPVHEGTVELLGPGLKGYLLPRVLDRIRVGIPKVEAARSVGLGKTTLWDWEQRDPRVGEAIHEAEAAAMGTYLSYIARAAQQGVWQAAAWMLERRWPERFGRTVQEHQGAGGGPVKIDVKLSLGDGRSVSPGNLRDQAPDDE